MPRGSGTSVLRQFGVNSKQKDTYADDDWYRELSENYTHPTPGTRPNEHGGLPWVGGKYEYEGLKNCYGRLMYVLAMLSMFICRWFKFDDLFKEIADNLGEREDEAGTSKRD